MSLRVLGFGILFMAMSFFCAPLATAQLSLTIEEAIQRLTGQGSKDWIREQFVTILGAEDSCKKGEVWRFNKEGQVEVRTCVEGKTTRETKPWELLKENELDLAIKVSETQYTILLPLSRAGSGVEEMRLRVISPLKTTPTVDLRFTHERD